MKAVVVPLRITSVQATFAATLKAVFDAVDAFSNTFFNAATPAPSATSGFSSRTSSRQMNKFFRNNSFMLIVGAVLVLVLIGVGYKLLSGDGTASGIGDEDQRVELQKAKATQTLNKTYSFPLRDSSGKEVSKIKYEILSAELKDQFIHKGRRATAVQGRTFIILNLKVTNDFNKGIQINTRDYVRLLANNSNERLAPDIHNDPVEIQAISTKYTRVGFPINDTDKNLILQVGEINGKKENIKLTLQ